MRCSAFLLVLSLFSIAATRPTTKPATLEQQCIAVAANWRDRFAAEKMASIVSPPFVVAGDGGEARVNRYVNSTIKASADALERKFFDLSEPDKPIVILLFESDEP